MKYYKYLDIEYSMSCQQLKKYALDNLNKLTLFQTDIDKEDILEACPDLQKMFDPLKITIKTVSFITTDNIDIEYGIHIDVLEYEDLEFSPIRINLPVLNCEGSITNFYTSSYLPVNKQLSENIYYLGYEYENCQLVDSFCLNRPAVLRVDEIHQVIANPNYHLPRISCSIEFEEDLEFLFKN